MTNDGQERRMLEAARSYNEPPEPPREAMWAAIREALPPAGSGGSDDEDRLDLHAHRTRRGVDRLRRWTPRALGLAAATLVVGFGLGRITGASERAPAPTVAPATDASLPVRLAAAEHLGEAEALLTLYRSTDRAEDRLVTARWARDLLGTTRVLIDSRAGRDPVMAQLLGDLELVLVQIALAASDPDDHSLIEDGIRERHLLSKLRSAAAPMDAAL